MPERLVKKMKQDYMTFLPKPNVRTVLWSLAAVCHQYNGNHLQSAGITIHEDMPMLGGHRQLKIQMLFSNYGARSRKNHLMESESERKKT